MEKAPTVSLCLIAMDEEAAIGECIHSARHLTDEVIVVDTGSRDSTAEVAASLGARIFRYAWKGDFAAARNFGLDHATGDWILVLDCDEQLEEVAKEELTMLLTIRDVQGYFINIRSLLGDGQEEACDQVVRLFRNHPAYRFHGAIHEQVAGAILQNSKEGALRHAPLTIRHTGYLDTAVRERGKYQRNTGILHEQLKTYPEDPFLLYCLAVEYCQHTEAEKGIVCLEKALEKMNGTEGYYRDALSLMLLGCWKLGKFTGAAGHADPSNPMPGWLCRNPRHTSTCPPGLWIREIQTLLSMNDRFGESSLFPVQERLQELYQQLARVIGQSACPDCRPGEGGRL